MECNWKGISGLTLKKLSSKWNKEDQVVTEYRTITIDGKYNVLMVWGTGPGTGSCDLFFNYPVDTVLVLVEVEI